METQDHPPVILSFTTDVGAYADLTENPTCLDFPNIFFDDEFYDIIVTQTNL